MAEGTLLFLLFYHRLTIFSSSSSSFFPCSCRKAEGKGSESAMEEFNLMTLGDASHVNNNNIGIQGGPKELLML